MISRIISRIIGKIRFLLINKPGMPKVSRRERKRLKRLPNYSIVYPDQFRQMFACRDYRARFWP